MCICPLAERSPEDALAGVPRTVVSPLGVDGDARQRPAQPQGPEYPGRIRTELDAGSDLPKGVRLLEQLGVDGPLPECESGGIPPMPPPAIRTLKSRHLMDSRFIASTQGI
jgi:hypothetical protein